MVFCGIMSSNDVFSQNESKVKKSNTRNQEQNISQSKKERINSLMVELDGFFQLQINNLEYKPLFTQELLERIKVSREDQVDVFIDLDEYSRLFIPSRNSINSDSYRKIENIIYTTK